MPVATRSSVALEVALLRKGVGALAAGRSACARCARTPLTGERVHFYGSGAKEALLCELCRPSRREAPGRSETVRGIEHDRCVRVRRGPG